MQKQKKTWSQYEDNALKTLRDVRKIQKWSQIAKILEEQFQVKGKNGKRCRERYHNHLSSEVKKEVWSEEEQNKLIKLHNQKGNRWAQIAKALGRSDNAVKNHYHSKLRKGIRRINYRINAYFKNQHKLLRNNIISKIVQTAEKVYFGQYEDKKTLPYVCFEMKNKILEQAKDSEDLTPQQIQNLKKLVTQINAFNRTFKKKSKKNEKPNNEPHKTGQNLAKNLHINISAEIQQQFSESSKQIDENSDESMNQEDQVSKNQIKQQILENKTEKRTLPSRQQTIKKYQLRNSRGREVVKTEVKVENQMKMTVESQKKVEISKAHCKTPEVFQEINFKNHTNINTMINVGFIPPFPLGYQCFNYPIYQSLMSSFTPFEENESLDFYRKNSLNPFDLLMIPSGNLIWSFNNHLGSENQKMLTSKASQNIIVQNGFASFRKQ